MNKAKPEINLWINSSFKSFNATLATHHWQEKSLRTSAEYAFLVKNHLLLHVNAQEVLSTYMKHVS